MRAALVAALVAFALPAWADAVQTSHGLSAFGDLKYGPEFQHFDYVNPDAPKGGTIVTTSILAAQTYDSLNGYILKGDPADGTTDPYNLLFDSLMTRAYDEADAVYALAASHAEYIPGGDWIIFQLRDEAAFSDGSPITAEDVANSFDLLKTKGHPAYRLSLRDVESAEAVAENRVRFNFAKDAPKRDLPMMVATLPIFSKAYYTENDFTESTLDAPLSSGPYRVKGMDRPRSITYERREDYWGKDLPVNKGRWNFGEITFEYFSDRDAAFQGLTSGTLDLREEFSSKIWGTRYDFPALEDGRVKKGVIPDERPAGTQGYWINTRLEKFSDPRVRHAIALAFDFEWSNRTLFYDLYTRTDSFFENSPFEAEGMPTEGELALLEPFRDQLPEAVFGEAYVPPVTDGSGRNRRALRTASKLLDEAGWGLVEGKRVKDGEPLTIEFLDQVGGGFARITDPYIQNLQRLGIDAKRRDVDLPQYQRRREAFEYDIITSRLTFSLTPGPSLLNVFSAESASDEGSSNVAGIADPVVDALIEEVIAADNRDDMQTALRALDRVMRASHYWVPQWSKGSHTLAWWDKFGFPETKPKYTRGVMDTWWVKE
jgi:microcin C transport system substrate-binding protein